MTKVIGDASFFGASGVAGSMLGTFLCVIDGAGILSEVCDVDAREGDIKGEIVGGCKGEQISSDGIGELHISGKTSVPAKLGVFRNLGDWSGEMISVSPANVAAGCRGGGSGASASAAEWTLIPSSPAAGFSLGPLSPRKKFSKWSSGGVSGE